MKRLMFLILVVSFPVHAINEKLAVVNNKGDILITTQKSKEGPLSDSGIETITINGEDAGSIMVYFTVDLDPDFSAHERRKSYFWDYPEITETITVEIPKADFKRNLIIRSDAKVFLYGVDIPKDLRYTFDNKHRFPANFELFQSTVGNRARIVGAKRNWQSAVFWESSIGSSLKIFMGNYDDELRFTHLYSPMVEAKMNRGENYLCASGSGKPSGSSNKKPWRFVFGRDNDSVAFYANDWRIEDDPDTALERETGLTGLGGNNYLSTSEYDPVPLWDPKTKTGAKDFSINTDIGGDEDSCWFYYIDG